MNLPGTLRRVFSLQQMVGLGGAIVLMLIWWALVAFGVIERHLVPTPGDVLAAIPRLYTEHELLKHMLVSIRINALSYIEALLLAIPIGFVIGKIRWVRFLVERYVVAMRYLPLTAVIFLFMLRFGIQTNMKVQFLTFSTLVYLIPGVIQRIDEVPEIYVNTVKTLGASQWQIIRTVYIPHVLAKVSDDARNLVAFTWTYIVYIEAINRGQGGLGALIWNLYYRLGKAPDLYALLTVIVLIGFSQDRIFRIVDRILFPFKYI